MVRVSGHTLVELAAVLATAGVLAGLAVPTLATTLAEVRGAAAAGELLAVLEAARRVAAASGRPVSLCVVDARQRCVLSGGRGFVTSITTGPTARPLQRRSLPPGMALASNRLAITYAAGGLAATPATLTLCDGAGRAQARAIILSRSGRLRQSDRDPAGGALACGR